MPTGEPDVAAALRHCAAVTRSEAANFYYGIRLLPRVKFEALCAIYAFARAVDDIGDGPLAPAEKIVQLGRARVSVEQLDAGSEDPVVAALASVERNFPIPRDAFLDLIDGVQMDLAGTRYETFDELVVYCRRVAGSIGRLCLSSEARPPLPTTSASRSSSPTSCATSARTRSTGASTCPRRTCSGSAGPGLTAATHGQSLRSPPAIQARSPR
jgi:phytoene/squalene synthetase